MSMYTKDQIREAMRWASTSTTWPRSDVERESYLATLTPDPSADVVSQGATPRYTITYTEHGHHAESIDEDGRTIIWLNPGTVRGEENIHRVVAMLNELSSLKSSADVVERFEEGVKVFADTGEYEVRAVMERDENGMWVKYQDLVPIIEAEVERRVREYRELIKSVLDDHDEWGNLPPSVETRLRESLAKGTNKGASDAQTPV